MLVLTALPVSVSVSPCRRQSAVHLSFRATHLKPSTDGRISDQQLHSHYTADIIKLPGREIDVFLFASCSVEVVLRLSAQMLMLATVMIILSLDRSSMNKVI